MFRGYETDLAGARIHDAECPCALGARRAIFCHNVRHPAERAEPGPSRKGQVHNWFLEKRIAKNVREGGNGSYRKSQSVFPVLCRLYKYCSTLAFLGKDE